MLPNVLPSQVHKGGAPRKQVVTPTQAQRESVRAFASTNLAHYTTDELRRALHIVTEHPDAHSAFYSPARSTRRRLEAELTSRPAL